MSNRNNICHVTGFNLSTADARGGPGSFFGANGNPGVLAGPVEGFSVAVGIRPATKASSSGVETPFATELDISPPIVSFPAQEHIAGNYDGVNNLGWGIALDPDVLTFTVGDLAVDASLLIPDLRGDMIALFSFVADDAPYGGGGLSHARCAVNGVTNIDSVTGITYAQSPYDFAIGGTFDPGYVALSPGVGGMYSSLLSSLWVTPGIPSIKQMQEFFDTSLQAGRIVPQAWAPAITQVGETPAVPAAPTGAFFLAPDADLAAGVGGTWTDRISGIELTRVGNAGTTPAAGDARFVAHQPWYSL